jgi:hypothetical protein
MKHEKKWYSWYFGSKHLLRPAQGRAAKLNIARYRLAIRATDGNTKAYAALTQTDVFAE